MRGKKRIDTTDSRHFTIAAHSATHSQEVLAQHNAPDNEDNKLDGSKDDTLVNDSLK